MPNAIYPRQWSEMRCETIPLPSHDAFNALVGRAEDGDDHAVAELQLLLDRHPSELCEALSDICFIFERHLIRLAAGDSEPMRWKIESFIAELRAGFMNGAGDPIESFLIHRIVVSYIELVIRRNQAANLGGARESALERAQQRQVTFLAACEDYYMTQAWAVKYSFEDESLSTIYARYEPR
jgi:hypothetical protein